MKMFVAKQNVQTVYNQGIKYRDNTGNLKLANILIPSRHSTSTVHYTYSIFTHVHGRN